MIGIMAGAGLAAIMLFSWLGQADAGAASGQSKKDDEMEVKKGSAPVDGLRIYYEIHGASPMPPPLVLLHCGGDTIETSFGHMLPEFARDRQVIAFEQRGYGHTADITYRPFSFEQSADDTAALLLYLHVDQADVLGFSSGGTIALQVAIRHPRMVRKLVIASGFFSRDGGYPAFWNGFALSVQTMRWRSSDCYHMRALLYCMTLMSRSEWLVPMVDDFLDAPVPKPQ